MTLEEAPSEEADDSRGSKLSLALLSLLVGCITGLVCACFRLLLQHSDTLRNQGIELAHQHGFVGLVALVACVAAACALAAVLVSRISPDAAGSGIPEVEAAISGGEPGRPVRNALVKFAGGLLAIGSGLALGREGPSVQMGHSIADVVARAFRRGARDSRVLFAAGAGAGLATAFNAPIAGAVFVLEELLRRFDARTSTAALGASAGAIAVARIFFGIAPDFEVAQPPLADLASVPVNVLLGVATALVAALYSRSVMGALALADRSRERVPVVARAAAIGALVGLLAWFAPSLVGGGDAITQQMLVGGASLSAIGLIFLVRFTLGPLSYAAGTPGGLFAPMLVLGAQVGLVFGRLAAQWLPQAGAPATSYAVIGIAAFFAALVRAPLTGICLAVEMTGSVNLLAPMLSACFGAMVVMNLLGIRPIYEQLRERARIGR